MSTLKYDTEKLNFYHAIGCDKRNYELTVVFNTLRI